MIIGHGRPVFALDAQHAEEPEDGEEREQPPLDAVGGILPVDHPGDGESGRLDRDQGRLWHRFLLDHEALEQGRLPQRQQLSTRDHLDLAGGQQIPSSLSQCVRLGGLEPCDQLLFAWRCDRDVRTVGQPAAHDRDHSPFRVLRQEGRHDPGARAPVVLSINDQDLAFGVEGAIQGHLTTDLPVVDRLPWLVDVGQGDNTWRRRPYDLDARPVPLPPPQPRTGGDDDDQDHHASGPAPGEQQFRHPVTVSRRPEGRGYSGAVANDQNAVRPWRLALVQENATVGDLTGNADLVLARTREAADAGACIVAFPEMFITGYPVEDLALRKSFIEASQHTVADLARRLDDEGLGDVAVIVGYLDSDADHVDRLGRPRHSPQNAAALLRAGAVEARYAKHHLPNYGVFDEYRYFVPGSHACTVEVADRRVAVAICEDLWQEGGPVALARASNADLLLVINGSPYERDKDDTRLELCSRRAVEAGMPLAYVNLVGGQDELVFDGDSLVVDKAGDLIARADQFTAELLCVDVFDAEAKPSRRASEAPKRSTRHSSAASATTSERTGSAASSSACQVASTRH